MLMSYIKLVFGEVINENSFYFIIKLKLEDFNNIREKIVFFIFRIIFVLIFCK